MSAKIEDAVEAVERELVILRGLDAGANPEIFNYHLIQVENAVEELREAFDSERSE